MFVQKTIYIIHEKNKPCGLSTNAHNSSSLLDSIKQFLITNYPKQKLLVLVFETLVQKDLINNDFYFKNHEHVHIIDFIRFINNRFDKNEKLTTPLQKLIKYLQTNNVRFPNACINNPLAKKFFC
jgi:hypothetical protein